MTMNEKRFGRRSILLSLLFALLVCALINISSTVSYFHLVSSLHEIQGELRELQSETRSLLPKKQREIYSRNERVDSRIAELESKLRDMESSKHNLELRVNSWMNWDSDPYLGSNQNPGLCKIPSDFTEFYCEEGKGGCQGEYSHPICMDSLRPGNCIVYDFGIRKNPHFGAALVKPPFNCKVFGFDPSPITKKWYDSDSADAVELRNNPNYQLFYFGAGGVDGEVRLNEYNWGQVSIVRFPMSVNRNCNHNASLPCELQMPTSGQFQLPVRTLGSIMKQLGHDHVDVLKLDVEGSEYMFLENAIEKGSLEHVDQLTVEWHHFDYDSRYGGGSTPSINAIVAMLNKIGLHQFFIHDDIGGWPADDRDFWKWGITMRYQLGSFLRVGLPPASQAQAV